MTGPGVVQAVQVSQGGMEVVGSQQGAGQQGAVTCDDCSSSGSSASQHSLEQAIASSSSSTSLVESASTGPVHAAAMLPAGAAVLDLATSLTASCAAWVQRLPGRFATASASAVPATAAATAAPAQVSASLQAMAAAVAGAACDGCGGLLSQPGPDSSGSVTAAAAGPAPQQQPLAFWSSDNSGVPSQTVSLAGSSSQTGYSIGLSGQSDQVDPRALPPDIDIVFIHGIRGGPFITWRKPGVQQVQVGVPDSTWHNV